MKHNSASSSESSVWNFDNDLKNSDMKLYSSDCLFQINKLYDTKRKRVDIPPLLLENEMSNISVQRSLTIDAWIIQVMKAKRRSNFLELFGDIQRKQQDTRQLFPLESR